MPLKDYTKSRTTVQPKTMAKPSRTLINTAIVALGYLLSRLLGVIRDIFITAQFGTAPVVDAYRAAFAIPDLLYLVIAGGALGTALIPVFQQRKSTSTAAEAWQLANSVITIALPLLVGAATIARLLFAIFIIIAIILFILFFLGVGALNSATAALFVVGL